MQFPVNSANHQRFLALCVLVVSVWGLTIVDLLVAISLSWVLLMMAAPGLRSFYFRMEFHAALRSVTTGLSAARYLAIQNNLPVRAEVIPGSLQLSVDQSQGWQVTRRFALSEKLSIRANSRPVFSPLGFVSPLCTITLESRGRTWRVVLSMYGRIKVYDSSV